MDPAALAPKSRGLRAERPGPPREPVPMSLISLIFPFGAPPGRRGRWRHRPRLLSSSAITRCLHRGRRVGRFLGSGDRSAKGVTMSKAGAWKVTVVLLLVSLATGARGDDPLTTTDLVKFLRAGISERTILAELHDRGFSEPLDLAREDALRDAGASETLVVAVRRVAP